MPACDANFITPDDFARLWRFSGRRTGLHRIEWLITNGARKLWCPNIRFYILTPYRNGKAQAHCIVEINNCIDSWQHAIPHCAFEKSLG